MLSPVIVPVASLSDSRLDDYRNVPDPELLRARGVFVAEGRLVVRRLLDASPYLARSVLLTPAAHAHMADAVERHPDLPIYVVSQDAMNAVTGFNIHRGCLAIGQRPPSVPPSEVVARASLAVVLERVSNADNVGGIFRSAAAFGAGAVLIGPGCADPLYRKAIRTSMGAVLSVPFSAAVEMQAAIDALRRHGFGIVALTPNRGAPPLRAVSRTARMALMVGHEGEGLSDAALAAADQRARIPTVPAVDSLNAAAAAAIALYELSGR